eukprot:2806402-Amphidinium_carterae.4
MLGNTIASHQRDTIDKLSIAPSSAEAGLCTMGQATFEAQHIKQVIEETAIPSLSQHVTMSINTDNSASSTYNFATCTCKTLFNLEK